MPYDEEEPRGCSSALAHKEEESPTTTSSSPPKVAYILVAASTYGQAEKSISRWIQVLVAER